MNTNLHTSCTHPTCRRANPSSLRNQHGSALIVGLVLLLVVTILAVAGMQDTLLQERMSGNWHDRNLAFQASEAALREGEAWLDASIANRQTAAGHDRLDDPEDWEGEDPHGTVDLSNSDVSFADVAAFHINPPSFSSVPGRMNIAQPECDRSFPTYGHGVGGSDNARVTLQSAVVPSSSGLVICPPDWGA